MWQNNAPFSGSQTAVGDFTTPAGVTSFQVGTAVVLDRGHLTFSDVTLRAYSDVIPVTAEDTYRFAGQVAGQLLIAAGQGGQVVAMYENAAGQSAGFDMLWENPANFNGTAVVQETFEANSGAATMRMVMILNLDVGHLSFSNFALEHQVTGFSTIERRSYSLGGQAIATRISGDPESGNKACPERGRLPSAAEGACSTSTPTIWAAPAC